MSQPNFLFLMTDHQRAVTVNTDVCHTPNIDRITAEGIRFRRAHTVNAMCSPNRATLFTGVHVHTHGMYDCTNNVDDARARFRTELPTWAQALANAGYHCAYFGKWHVERSDDLSRFGWRYQLRETRDEWRREKGYHGPEELSLGKSVGGAGYARRVLYGVVDDPRYASETEHIYSRGAEYLEEQLAGEEPWCLFLSTEQPGGSVVARRYYEMYDPAQLPQPPNFHDDLRGKPNVLKRMQRVWDELTEQDFAEAHCCSNAVCTMIDEQVGKVLAALERTGQKEKTIVVYLSDHGEMMGAHRLFGLGITPYEEVYNIPLVIRAPGVALAGADCDRLVSTGDLCPTVLELAGLAPFERSQFDSLVPLLEDPEGAEWRDEAYAEFHGQRYFFTQRILWRGHLKYILNAFDFDEMYDLAADPAELNNVADDPAYAPQKEEMLKGIWRNIHATGDTTLADAHYWSLRFFDLGPDCVEHD